MAKIGMVVTEEEAREATSGAPRRFGPGNYNFTVVEANLMENSAWKSSKIKVMMLAEHGGRDYKIFDDLWLSERAKWKYARFVKAIGMDPTEELDTEDFLGKGGMFRLKKQSDSDYMEPGTYYTPEEASVEELGPFKDDPSNKPAPKVSVADDDVFF